MVAWGEGWHAAIHERHYLGTDMIPTGGRYSALSNEVFPGISSRVVQVPLPRTVEGQAQLGSASIEGCKLCGPAPLPSSVANEKGGWDTPRCRCNSLQEGGDGDWGAGVKITILDALDDIGKDREVRRAKGKGGVAVPCTISDNGTEEWL